MQFTNSIKLFIRCRSVFAHYVVAWQIDRRGSINIVSFDELPHVLRCGLDAVFCQFIRDCSCTFPFSPQGKDLFPEREQRASPRSMFYCMTGESADDIQLFRTVMPVFGRFAFKLAIGFRTVKRQKRCLGRYGSFLRHQDGDSGRFAWNQKPNVFLCYLSGHCTTSLPAYFRRDNAFSV